MERLSSLVDQDKTPRLDPMTQWLVGYRDDDVIDDVVVEASSAVDAASLVRQDHPAAIIIAVIRYPEPTRWWDKIDYSDMPARYQELRRYVGPADGPHGFLVVSVSSYDGSRSIMPTRPISREQAVWHRDWLLRGYFESMLDHRRTPKFNPRPVPPVVMELQPIV